MKITVTLIALLIFVAVLIFNVYLLKKGKIKKKKYREYLKVVNIIISAIVGILGVSTISISLIFVLGGNVQLGHNITNYYNNDKQHDLLLIGKNQIEAGNYEEAFATYNSKDLEDNDYAKINIAYLYAHGLGTEENISKALEIYNEVDTDEAKRNKLGLLIALNYQGNYYQSSYNEQIDELINYFIKKDDYYFWNFLSLSKFGRCIDEILEEDPFIKQNFSFSLSDLYVFECKRGKYTDPPRNTAYVWYKFVGADFDVNPNVSQTFPYFYYDMYQLKYLKYIDQIWL